MQDQDFPALYRSANELAANSQGHFFKVLGTQLLALVIAATLSLVNPTEKYVATAQLLVLLGALSGSIYLFALRPDRRWYAGRAVAESIKTLTWRYACRAEPFENEDAAARTDFNRRLRLVIEQNREVCQLLTKHLSSKQITPLMEQMRTDSLEQRRSTYAEHRVKDQLEWYAKKASFNGKMSRRFFGLLITANAIAVICAALRITFVTPAFWPTDVFVAAAASILSWMQAKRFSELAASYALAAHEISLIREQSLLASNESEFSIFVGDAENAFSREHTQWVARMDA